MGVLSAGSLPLYLYSLSPPLSLFSLSLSLPLPFSLFIVSSGQDHAKRVLAVGVYQHYVRLINNLEIQDVSQSTPSILMSDEESCLILTLLYSQRQLIREAIRMSEERDVLTYRHGRPYIDEIDNRTSELHI